MNTAKLENLKGVLSTILLIGILGFGFYSVSRDKKLLENCSVLVSGEVIKVTQAHSKAPVVHYRYAAEGVEYTTSETIPKNIRRSHLRPKTKLRVAIACEDHTVSAVKK